MDPEFAAQMAALAASLPPPSNADKSPVEIIREQMSGAAQIAAKYYPEKLPPGK